MKKLVGDLDDVAVAQALILNLQNNFPPEEAKKWLKRLFTITSPELQKWPPLSPQFRKLAEADIDPSNMEDYVFSQLLKTGPQPWHSADLQRLGELFLAVAEGKMSTAQQILAANPELATRSTRSNGDILEYFSRRIAVQLSKVKPDDYVEDPATGVMVHSAKLLLQNYLKGLEMLQQWGAQVDLPRPTSLISHLLKTPDQIRLLEKTLGEAIVKWLAKNGDRPTFDDYFQVWTAGKNYLTLVMLDHMPVRDELGKTLFFYGGTELQPLSFAFTQYSSKYPDILNWKDNNGDTAVAFAGTPEIFDWFVQNGASLNNVNKQGWTILNNVLESDFLQHFVNKYVKPYTVDAEAMKNMPFDIFQRDEDGDTAADYLANVLNNQAEDWPERAAVLDALRYVAILGGDTTNCQDDDCKNALESGKKRRQALTTKVNDDALTLPTVVVWKKLVNYVAIPYNLPSVSLDRTITLTIRDEKTGTLYKDQTFSNLKLIGSGYNANVYCCISLASLIDQEAEKLVVKLPKYRGNGPALYGEYQVYKSLKQIGFPVVPIVATGGDGFCLIRPWLEPTQFGDVIQPLGLSPQQRIELEKMWKQANLYALITGIPLDLKMDNIWWDGQQWWLVDTGPRLDDNDPDQFGYTLSPSNLDQFLNPALPREKNVTLRGQGDKTSLVMTTVATGETRVIVPAYDLQVDFEAKKREWEEKLLQLVGRHDAVELSLLLLQALPITPEILRRSRSSVKMSQALCQQLSICPKDDPDDNDPERDAARDLRRSVKIINQLRADTSQYHDRLTPDMKKVIEAYTGADYRDMNKCLRMSTDSLSSKSCKDQVDNVVMMDMVLTDSEAPRLVEPLVVFRGLGAKSDYDETERRIIEALRALRPGDYWEDRGFVSTSVQHPPEAFVGKTCCIMEIRLPADTPAYYVGKHSTVSGEEEVILLPGMTLEFVGTKFGDQGTYYRGQRYVDTFVFQCIHCDSMDRFSLSSPPRELRLAEQIMQAKLPFQPQDQVVDIGRLGFYHLTEMYNAYVDRDGSGRPGQDVLRLVTWNVHEWRPPGSAVITRANLEANLETMNGDVIALQEVTDVGSFKRDREIWQVASSCEADQGSHGERLKNQIWTKRGIQVLESTTISLEPGNSVTNGDGRCMAVVVIRVFNQTVVIGNVHLDAYSGQKRFENIQRAVSAVEELGQKFSTRNIVLMGDFNSYRLEDYNTTEKWDAFRRLKEKRPQGLQVFEAVEHLNKLGWRDTFVQASERYKAENGDEVGAQLMIPANTTHYGGRIDFIFTHPNFDHDALHLDGVYAFYTNFTDHVAIIADFSPGARRAKKFQASGRDFPTAIGQQQRTAKQQVAPLPSVVAPAAGPVLKKTPVVSLADLPKTTSDLIDANDIQGLTDMLSDGYWPTRQDVQLGMFRGQNDTRIEMVDLMLEHGANVEQAAIDLASSNYYNTPSIKKALTDVFLKHMDENRLNYLFVVGRLGNALKKVSVANTPGSRALLEDRVNAIQATEFKTVSPNRRIYAVTLGDLAKKAPPLPDGFLSTKSPNTVDVALRFLNNKGEEKEILKGYISINDDYTPIADMAKLAVEKFMNKNAAKEYKTEKPISVVYESATGAWVDQKQTLQDRIRFEYLEKPKISNFLGFATDSSEWSKNKTKAIQNYNDQVIEMIEENQPQQLKIFLNKTGYLPGEEEVRVAIGEERVEILALLLDANPKKELFQAAAATFGFYLPVTLAPNEKMDQIAGLLQAKLGREEFLHYINIGLIVRAFTSDSIKNHLATAQQYVPYFQQRKIRADQKVDGKTLLEWVDDQEHFGPKPPGYPRDEIIALIQSVTAQ